MKDLLDKSLDLVKSTKDTIVNELNSSVSLVVDMVNKIPVFVSAQFSDKYSDKLFDEKHYFVIPYKLSDQGIALHTIRCLPKGVAEINDLPKRRIFHFSNEHAETLIRQNLMDEALLDATERHDNKISSLESLANDIDELDKKLTYGMLCIGGLAALINPIAGAGIAAKALLPGIGGLVSKYTLRPMGEKMTEVQLEKEIKHAQDKIIKEFESAETLSILNPILQELELAINTTEAEHDPLIDFNLGDGSVVELQGERWRELTVTALKHVYHDVLKTKSKHQKAGLGQEDLRWLEVLFK
jgi:hypothetical protein